jgi:2-keto-4-pentenoate hydratase
LEDTTVIATAARIGAARIASKPMPELDGNSQPADIAEGYRVQSALHDYLKTETSGSLAGWKIGATTGLMQNYLGVEGPAYGRIMTSNVYKNGTHLDLRDFCNPGIECEIAIRLNSDSIHAPYTSDTVGDIVGSLFAAIEIVENRYGNFLERGAPTLIADDFFHKACILGKEVSDWNGIDLITTTGRTLIDSHERGSGTGAEVMGHPLKALAWLANTLAERGWHLQSDQIVLTGSLTPVIWLTGLEEAARIEVDCLGKVEVTLS